MILQLPLLVSSYIPIQVLLPSLVVNNDAVPAKQIASELVLATGKWHNLSGQD